MTEEQGDVVPASPEVHFEPIVNLPLVEIKTLEENEDTLFTMRAKLFRYESTEDTPEWKERGTGEVKILKHKTEDFVRILMRRDKTLKICANHYIYPYMELKPHSSSDRAWVYSVLADFADEEPKPELFAMKFANVENAQNFKAAFESAKDVTSRLMQHGKREQDGSEEESSDEENENNSNESSPVKASLSKDSEEVSEKLSNLTVEENQNSDSEKKESSSEEPEK